MSTRPEARRAFLRAGSSLTDEEAQRFYATRVADYARLLGIVFGGMYLVGVVVALLFARDRFWAVHTHPAKLAHLAFAGGSLVLSKVVRRPACPRWFVSASDGALPINVALVVAILAHSTPVGYGIHLVPLLLAALVLILRAGLVPSPPWRTALVSALTSVPSVWACTAIAMRDEELMAKLGRDWPTTAVPPWFGIAFGSLIWCAALTIATTYVSRVIYGLQREVQTAQRLGQYVLGELIGEGMGAVYQAQHALLRRPTAVKLLHPDRVGPQSLARFEREVQITARLTHPNTVAIFDYGHTPDGVFYYAMEYLEGVSLQELVERFGPQPQGRVVHILIQAAGALAEAHSLALIHRDIKPANMLFCERGGMPDVVKLVDFGLVKRVGPSNDPELTQADAITGTPQFLAPESIIDPSAVDHRVDIYGLGCVAYFLLTGKPPFEGKSVVEVCGHHLHSAPQKPSERLGAPLDAELEALVLACLEKKPDARPRDAAQLLSTLSSCAARLPWTAEDARTFWAGAGRG
ncbi:MAG TPA: serine/threonine-protein kinase [Polyangiaceae bacterium]|nr:serine/threonine-protein kinase [Polyangiaceae bacterium]